MKTTILFDEATHTYTVNGIVKPSVTKVLNTLIKLEQFNCYVDTTTGNTIPADYIEDAGDFGRAVHKAAKWIFEDRAVMWPDTLDHAMSELQRWKEDNGIVPVIMEMIGYSSKLDVCGTLDLTCHINKGPHANKVLNLVDYKTTENAPMVGPQTWAYEQIYREMTGYRGVIKRWVLYLPKKEGEYKFIELSDRADEHEFKARNYCYKWERR